MSAYFCSHCAYQVTEGTVCGLTGARHSRFDHDLDEVNRIRWDAIQKDDQELHRQASEQMFLLTRGYR